MTDPTAGRSAGTRRNAELDPMGQADDENRRSASEDPRRHEQASHDPRDPTSGRSAETRRNVEQDPTRAARPDQ